MNPGMTDAYSESLIPKDQAEVENKNSGKELTKWNENFESGYFTTTVIVQVYSIICDDRPWQ